MIQAPDACLGQRPLRDLFLDRVLDLVRVLNAQHVVPNPQIRQQRGGSLPGDLGHRVLGHIVLGQPGHNRDFDIPALFHSGRGDGLGEVHSIVVPAGKLHCGERAAGVLVAEKPEDLLVSLLKGDDPGGKHRLDALFEGVDGEPRELELKLPVNRVGNGAALYLAGDHAHVGPGLPGHLHEAQRLDILALGQGYLGALFVGVFLEGFLAVPGHDLQALLARPCGQLQHDAHHEVVVLVEIPGGLENRLAVVLVGVLDGGPLERLDQGVGPHGAEENRDRPAGRIVLGGVPGALFDKAVGDGHEIIFAVIEVVDIDAIGVVPVRAEPDIVLALDLALGLFCLVAGP